jgi:glycerol kinase
MSALFLGVDQGTHSSRALLFDEQGNEVASAHEKVDINRFEGGRVEQDADQLVASVKNVIHSVLQAHGNNKSVKSCGIATQRSTVLSWTAKGIAGGPVLSWQDVRGSALIKSLRQHKTDIKKLSGLPLSAHYGASKMRWLYDHFQKHGSPSVVCRLSPLVSFLLYHLLDNKPYRVDHSNAQRTQLMNIDALNWSEQLMEWFGVPVKMLPECVPMCTDYGVLTNSGIPVSVVCGDQNAAMFGVGEMPESTALVNLGSGAFILRAMPSNQHSAKQLSGIAYSDNKTVQYVREATINGAGSAISWLEKKHGLNDVKQRLNGWLETVNDPPLFINTVGGLGSPWWRQDIKPGFIDANRDDEASLVVAVVESILFMVRANLDLIIAEQSLEKIRVSGGLSNPDALCQKLANLCGLPVERTDNVEATARGVAWLAAGRPANWMHGGLIKSFKPANDEALHRRYSTYMTELNHRMEMSA